MSEHNAPLLSGESSDSYQQNDQSINQSFNPQYSAAAPQYGHPMHQPIQQPIQQPVDQTFQQPMHQPMHQPMQQPVYAHPIQQGYDPSINQPIYAQPAPHGYNPAMNQPLNPAIGQPIYQPISQPGFPVYGTAPVVTVVSIPAGQPGHIQTFGRWSDGLFDCFNAPMICVTSWLLPCYRWPTTIARVGLMGFAAAVLLYGAIYLGSLALSVVDMVVYGADITEDTRPFGSSMIQMFISCLGLCAVSLGAYHRLKLREKYQIVGSGFGDWCTYFWCSCCAIAQEARHVDRDYGLIL